MQLLKVNFTVGCGARPDSISNIDHTRNADAYYSSYSLYNWQMLYFSFVAQTSAVCKCFSNIEVELWTDRFRLRSLSSTKKLSMLGWGEKLEHCGLTELGESAGSEISIKEKHMLRSGAKDDSRVVASDKDLYICINCH